MKNNWLFNQHTNTDTLRFEKFPDISSSKQYNLTNSMFFGELMQFSVSIICKLYCFIPITDSQKIYYRISCYSWYQLESFEELLLFLLQFRDSNHVCGLIYEKYLLVKIQITSDFLQNVMMSMSLLYGYDLNEIQNSALWH